MRPYLLACAAFFAVIGIGLASDVAHAQGTFVPLAETTGQGNTLGGLYSSQGNLTDFLNRLFKFAIGLGAIAAVLRLAYAGYLYMGQSDMWSYKGQAKEIIGNVVLGLLLLLSVWIILKQINPDILKLDALRSIRPAQTQQETGGSSWCIAGGGSCYPTQAECETARSFVSPLCFQFNN